MEKFTFEITQTDRYTKTVTIQAEDETQARDEVFQELRLCPLRAQRGFTPDTKLEIVLVADRASEKPKEWEKPDIIQATKMQFIINSIMDLKIPTESRSKIVNEMRLLLYGPLFTKE